MSNAFYPLGLIEDLKVERLDRTVIDTFEDGSSSANSIWGPYQFKRRFTVRHAPLSQQEFRYLRSFFGARSGRYDSFWFRDNVHRGGNALVRLASPLPERRGASGYYTGVELVLEEVAPIRIQPDYEDVATASGQGMFGRFHVWLDANRELEYTMTGDTSTGLIHSTTLKNFARNDSSNPAYDLSAVHPATIYGKLNDLTAQYQSLWSHYWPASTYRKRWKSSAFNFLSGGFTPAVTLFALVKHGTSTSADKVLFGAGTNGAGLAHGIQLGSDNYYRPWLGGSESWTTALFQNSPADTWRSIAITWPEGSSAASLYVNGALVGTETEARNYVGGYIFLNAAPDDTLLVSAQAFNNAITHSMMWAAELSLAQIKALHNLFAYQYGLATV